MRISFLALLVLLFFITLFRIFRIPISTLDPVKFNAVREEIDQNPQSRVLSASEINNELDSIVSEMGQELKESFIEVKDPLKVVSSPDRIAIEINGEFVLARALLS